MCPSLNKGQAYRAEKLAQAAQGEPGGAGPRSGTKPAAAAGSGKRRSSWVGGQVSARTICIQADNSSPMTFEGTNTWICFEPGHSGCVVVDPGPKDRLHGLAIIDACRCQGLRIEAIILTHDHSDHGAGAASLAAKMGVEVYGRRLGNLPDGLFRAKASMPRLQVVSLPGHSRDSIGLLFAADRSMLTGDLVFKEGSSVVYWPDGDLADYLASLKRVRSFAAAGEVRRILAGHGAPIDEPLARVGEYEMHRRARLDQVRRVFRMYGSPDCETVVQQVYSGLDPRLIPAARRNVEAQLKYLADKGDPCMLPVS